MNIRDKQLQKVSKQKKFVRRVVSIMRASSIKLNICTSMREQTEYYHNNDFLHYSNESNLFGWFFFSFSILHCIHAPATVSIYVQCTNQWGSLQNCRCSIELKLFVCVCVIVHLRLKSIFFPSFVWFKCQTHTIAFRRMILYKMLDFWLHFMLVERIVFAMWHFSILWPFSLAVHRRRLWIVQEKNDVVHNDGTMFGRRNFIVFWRAMFSSKLRMLTHSLSVRRYAAK